MFLRVSGKSFVLVFLLCFFLGYSKLSIGAAKLPKGPMPDWVTVLSVKSSTRIKAKDVSGGYHVLLRDSQFDLASQTKYHHNGYLIFTDEGLQSVSEIQVEYDPNFEKVTFHVIRIWRNGKLIDKLPTVNFKLSQVEKESDKHIYNEQLSAIAILDDVRINDVVEFAYSVKGWNPIFQNKFFNSFNLRSYDPMDEFFYKVNFPLDRKLNYKLFNTTEQPAIAVTGTNQAFTWHMKNLPGFPVDSDIPSWYDPYPWVSLSEYGNWQEFGKWAASLYDVKGLSKDLQQEIDSIKKTSGDTGDRITATVRFVQDKIRYLGLENGISGYKPHLPAQIFQQRFGDCKDKSLLLSKMLQAMDIKAYPALVHTSYQNQVQKWLPSAYAFDHCIVVIELLGKKIWIDPTISLQRGRYDSIATPNYKTAFVLKNGNGQFQKMQTPAIAKTKVLENFIFNDIGGAVTLEVKSYYYGAEADGMRQRMATSNLKETEKSYLNFYASTYPNITVARDLDFIDDPEKNILITLEEYIIKDLWTPEQKNKDSSLTTYFYPQVLRDRLGKPGTVIRKMPISLYYPFKFEEIITLLMPEAWPVDAETNVIQDKSFRFQSDISYRAASKSIILSYHYQHLRDYVPVAEATGYLKKQKEVLNNLGYELTKHLRDKPTDKPVNSLMVGLGILFLLGWTFGAYKLYRQYDPKLSDKPPYQQDIGGWLVVVLLGLYFTPFIVVTTLFKNKFLAINIWDRLFTLNSEIFDPVQSLIILFEIAGNIGFLVFSILLLVLFHKKRTSVPKLMIVYFLGKFSFIFIDKAISENVTIIENNNVSFLISFIGTAIWVPYFLKSERVKRTFTKTLCQPEPVPELETEEAKPLLNA